MVFITPSIGMRSLYALLLGFALGLSAAATAQGQTFTYGTSGPLPDQCHNLCFPIAVQGLPAAASDTFGLASVCINITHTYVGDLTIVLRNPVGDSVVLVNRVGGGSQNFVGTCLAMDGPTQIGNGASPFTGVFVPDQDINLFNRGANPNGVWRLCVTDNAAQDEGVLNSFSLTFSRNPPPSPPAPASPCSFANMGACLCPDGSDTCDLLPDMTASASIMRTERTEYNGRITISNATPNIGYGPLEIHGTGECYCDSVRVNCDAPCPTGIREKVIQTVYRKTGSTYTTYERPAGYMIYHANHGHVHMEEWSHFTLRNRTADPNPLRWPVVATGEKLSFCLVNLADCRTANSLCVSDAGRVLDMDSMPNSGLGLVTGCSRDQGIWPGKADIYNQTLPGQEIPLAGVCNGTYYIVSHTDPNNNVLERSDSNNVAFAPVTLTRQTGPQAYPIMARRNGPSEFIFSSPIPAGRRFRWDFGDGAVDSVNAIATHTYAVAGNYVVSLKVFHPCAGASNGFSVTTSQTTATITTNKPNLTAADLGLEAVPNPAEAGRFTLRYRKVTAAPGLLQLQDLAGRTLISQPTEAGTGAFAMPMQATGLAAGIYRVTYTTEVGTATIRVMLR